MLFFFPFLAKLLFFAVSCSSNYEKELILRKTPEVFYMDLDEPTIKFVKEGGVIKLTPRNFYPLLNYYDEILYLYCGKRFH